MCGLKKIFLATFIYLLALVCCEQQLTVGDKGNVVEIKTPQAAVLTPIKVEESYLGTIYTYQCSVGTFSSNNLVCNTNSTTIWRDAVDVNKKIRCGNTESDLMLSYVDIIFSVSSTIVDCFVHEGSIGLGHIGLSVKAWNTTLLSYTVAFYTY